MRSRWLVFFLVVMLTAPSVSAAWAQYQGNAERSGHLQPFPALLDVLEVGRLRDDHMDLGGMDQAPVVLRGTDGWTWAERHPGGVCAVVTRPVLADPTSEHLRESDDCNSGLLQALDPKTRRVLLCNYDIAEEIVLRAIEPDGRIAWSVTPNATLGLPSSSADQVAGRSWRCQGTALDLDARVAYVAFHEGCSLDCTGLHRIAALRLDDGALVWRSDIQEGATQEGVFEFNNVVLPNEGQGAHPGGITIVGDSIVVSYGKTCSTCEDERQVAFAWFDRTTGRQVGWEDRDELETHDGIDLPIDEEVSGSRFAVAKDGIAVFYHYGSVVILDPRHEDPLQRIGVDHKDDGVRSTASPAWWNQFVAVPSQKVLHTLDIERGEIAWTWSGGHNWHIEQVSATSDGELVVLLVDVVTEKAAKLVRLHAASGTLVQELPVFLEVSFDNDGYFGAIWRVDLLQGDGGDAVLFDQHGGYARIGSVPTQDAPRISLGDAYPSTGAPVDLTLDAKDAASEVDRVFVSWGDGNRGTYAVGEEITHRYAENGDHDIVATMIHTDNTTRSAKATVHVGATPPRELTPVQQVFAPENADVTWGIIGVLVALVGGIIAFTRSRMRKNRLEYRLAVIEGIKRRGETEPADALRDLDVHQSDLRADLRDGRVDDIQYAVLSTEIHKVRRLLYHRILTPYEGRMSNGFRQRLEASLEDGTLYAPEAERLLKDLKNERRLGTNERQHMARLLEDWTQRSGQPASP